MAEVVVGIHPPGAAQAQEPARAVNINLPAMPEHRLAQDRFPEMVQSIINNSVERTLLAEASGVDIDSQTAGAQDPYAVAEAAVSTAFLSLRSNSPTYQDFNARLEYALTCLRGGYGSVIRGAHITDPALQEQFLRANQRLSQYGFEVYQQCGPPVSDQAKNAILQKFQELGRADASHYLYPQELAISAGYQNLSPAEASAVIQGINNHKRYNAWPSDPYESYEKDRRAAFNQSLARLQRVAAGQIPGMGQFDQFMPRIRTPGAVEPVKPPEPQKEEITYENTVNKAWELVQRNATARDVLSMLKQRNVHWSDTAVTPGDSARINRQDVAGLVSWITTSTDWSGWAEVSSVLEGDFTRTVDRQGRGLQYRAARDEFIEAIRPYMVMEKMPPIPQELTYWENSFSVGGRCLDNRAQMQQRYQFQRVGRGRFVFYGATSQQLEPAITRFEEMSKKLGQVLGQEGTKRVHVVLVPEVKYCPRGGYAKLDGTGLILAPIQDVDHVYMHEAVHAELGQIFGASKSATAAEGAAMYLARTINQSGTGNDYVAYTWGDDQITNVSRQGGNIGLSHTGLLDAAGTPRSQQDYEYAYKFGGLLAEFIVSRVGISGYLKFYQRTCMPNLYDSESGKPLIINGFRQAGVGEREINAQALKAMAVSTGRPDMRPENIMQEFSAFAAARNAKGAF